MDRDAAEFVRAFVAARLGADALERGMVADLIQAGWEVSIYTDARNLVCVELNGHGSFTYSMLTLRGAIRAAWAGDPTAVHP